MAIVFQPELPAWEQHTFLLWQWSFPHPLSPDCSVFCRKPWNRLLHAAVMSGSPPKVTASFLGQHWPLMVFSLSSSLFQHYSHASWRPPTTSTTQASCSPCNSFLLSVLITMTSHSRGSVNLYRTYQNVSLGCNCCLLISLGLEIAPMSFNWNIPPPSCNRKSSRGWWLKLLLKSDKMVSLSSAPLGKNWRKDGSQGSFFPCAAAQSTYSEDAQWSCLWNKLLIYLQAQRTREMFLLHPIPAGKTFLFHLLPYLKRYTE